MNWHLMSDTDYKAYIKKLNEALSAKHKPLMIPFKPTKRPENGGTRTEYALYYGDRFLDLGDKYYLGEKYRMRPEYVYWLSTPSGLKQFEKSGEKAFIAVKLEDNDNE